MVKVFDYKNLNDIEEIIKKFEIPMSWRKELVNHIIKNFSSDFSIEYDDDFKCECVVYKDENTGGTISRTLPNYETDFKNLSNEDYKRFLLLLIKFVKKFAKNINLGETTMSDVMSNVMIVDGGNAIRLTNVNYAMADTYKLNEYMKNRVPESFLKTSIKIPKEDMAKWVDDGVLFFDPKQNPCFVIKFTYAGYLLAYPFYLDGLQLSELVYLISLMKPDNGYSDFFDEPLTEDEAYKILKGIIEIYIQAKKERVLKDKELLEPKKEESKSTEVKESVSAKKEVVQKSVASKKKPVIKKEK